MVSFVAVAELPVQAAAVVALVAFVAFVTAVAPICPTISAAEATATALVPEPLSNAPEVKDVAPVPPLVTGRVPVVPPSIGNPVAFVNVADDGVPKAGVTSVGLVDSTTLPEPVEAVTPVPPRATERVPVVPATIGSPVALVNVADDGVPSAGVTSVGLVANTKEPEPVSSVTAAARFADDGVARNVATLVPSPEMPVATGRPVTLVITPLAGVPKAGVVSVGLVSVLLVSVCMPDSVATVESIATVTAEAPL